MEARTEDKEARDIQEHCRIEFQRGTMAEQAGNLTFAIIKPDAVSAGHTGKIIDRIISDGFRIRALKMIQQSRAQAEGFYDVHRAKPFFAGLTEFMSSRPRAVMVLEKDGA